MIDQRDVDFTTECGKGWAPIIRGLTDLCRLHGVSILQVKEKFGGLRFYTGGTPAWLQDFILVCEDASLQVCETCGRLDRWQGAGDSEPARVTTEGSGWITTRCQWCRQREEESHAPTVDVS